MNASGTLTFTLATQTKNTVLAGPTTGANAQPTFRALAAADLPLPTTSTVGGVEAINSVSHEWINAINTSGVPQLSQPSVSDLTNGTLGTNTSTTGQLGLANGNALGATVTVQNNSATAGYNFNLPADAGTAGYVLTSGGGVAAPMTWTQMPSATGSTSITTLGTVTTGTWNASTITVPYGGTGATTLTANGLLVGNGTSPVNALAPQNSSVLLTNGSGVPAWATSTNDNFTQYALLAGRAGGQALDGGTAAADSLTLNSTSHAGPTGYVLLQTGGGSVGIGTTTPVSSLDLSQKKDAITLPSGNGTTDRPGSPVAGMLRYNTGGTLEFYNGASWQTLGVSGAGISSLTAGTGLTGGTITTTGTIALATPTTSTIGGVEAINSVSHQWINSINTSGVPQLSQPSVSDLTNGTLGTNTSTTGQLGLANGNASGATVTVQNNSATTAYTFNLPAAAGSLAQFLLPVVVQLHR